MLPYASSLFGDTPTETLEKAKWVPAAGHQAAKFGWGPIGTRTEEMDADHFHAAREDLPWRTQRQHRRDRSPQSGRVPDPTPSQANPAPIQQRKDDA
jgi:hypothetical protein